MNLKDLLNDVLSVLNASSNIEELNNTTVKKDEITGSIYTDEPTTVFCLPLYKTSFRENIISELNNTVVMLFDHITINDIISRVGIFITSAEGIVDIEARILGYYTSVEGGRTILANSWQLYQVLNEEVN